MKKLFQLYFLLVTFLLFPVEFLLAQTSQTISISYTPDPIIIDGYIEETWDAVCPLYIQKPFRREQPTLTAYWKALYDETFLYFLIDVFDEGNHWPGWKSGGDPLEYDMPIIYLDVNDEQFDGKGVKDIGTGHYWFAESFIKGKYDTPIEVEATENSPGGIVAYSLGYGANENNYVYELAIPFKNLKNKYGSPLIYNFNHPIGFDVYIIDQDEGITTAPQRMVWQNDGILGDCWNNMDGAGRINCLIIDCCTTPAFFVSTYFVIIPEFDGSEAKVILYAEKNWTAESDQPWLTINPSSGSYSNTLTFTATQNNFDTIRSAFINVIDIDSNIIKIMVVQEANPVSSSSTFEKEKIGIYPNPVNDYFVVKGLDNNAIVHITDLNRKTIFSKKVKGNGQIESGKLIPGFYIAIIETGNQRYIRKFLKSN